MSKHPWVELDADALRQLIDAESAFTAWEAARKLGNEVMTKILAKTLVRHQRMNKALRVGRTPRIVVDVLNRLSLEGLSFLVVGTHALYAYETAAAVRLKKIDPKATLRFRIQGGIDNDSLLGVLWTVDSTFEKRPSQRFAAANSKGFKVEMEICQDEQLEKLQHSDLFSRMIASSTGHMARMSTFSPVVFAKLKRWEATQSGIDTLEYRRDIRLAELVKELVRECLPVYDIE